MNGQMDRQNRIKSTLHLFISRYLYPICYIVPTTVTSQNCYTLHSMLPGYYNNTKNVAPVAYLFFHCERASLNVFVYNVISIHGHTYITI